MAAAPIPNSDDQDSAASAKKAGAQHAATRGPHMLVKTVLPPSNVVKAVRGNFSRPAYRAATCVGNNCQPVTNDEPGAAMPIDGTQALGTEVVLATATSLRLVSIEPAVGTVTATMDEHDETSDSRENEYATVDGDSVYSKTICQQPVFGTVAALAVLGRNATYQPKGIEADLLLMNTMESAELVVLQYSTQICRFEVVARVPTRLEGQLKCIAVSPDSDCVVISCSSPGDPMVICVAPRHGVGAVLQFGYPSPLPLAALSAGWLDSQADREAALKRWEVSAAVHVAPEQPQALSVDSMCFCSEGGLQAPPLLAVLVTFRHASGDLRQSLWKCALPRRNNSSYCSQESISFLEVVMVQPRDPTKAVRLPYIVTDFRHPLFTQVAPVPSQPTGVLMIARGVPHTIVHLPTMAEQQASNLQLHRSAQPSKAAETLWCWEEGSEHADHPTRHVPTLLTANKAGQVRRISASRVSPGASVPDDPVIAQLEGRPLWLMSLPGGCLLAGLCNGSAHLLAPQSHGHSALQKVATVAVGAASVASPLIVADLAQLAQPQLYSICSNARRRVDKPSDEAEGGHLRAVYPHPMAEVVFESAPDYGGITGLWALPARPHVTVHAVVILSFVSASRALSTAGENLTDATEAVALAADMCTLDAGCIADLLAAQVTVSHVQLCSLSHVAGEHHESPVEGCSPTSASGVPGKGQSMGKRHASCAAMEALSALAAQLKPYTSSGMDCDGGPSFSDPAVMRSAGSSSSGIGSCSRTFSMPIGNDSCGRVHSFGRDSACSGGAGGSSSVPCRAESHRDPDMPAPLDMWWPPEGDSISVAKVVPGAVLLSCAGSEEILALTVQHTEQRNSADSTNSGGSKRKRGCWGRAASGATLVHAASANVAAELSCITATFTDDFARQSGTLVCVGTHEPTIELLLLTAGNAVPGSCQQRQQHLHDVQLCRLACMPLLAVPQQLPDLWPHTDASTAQPSPSTHTAASAAAAAFGSGNPRRSSLDRYTRHSGIADSPSRRRLSLDSSPGHASLDRSSNAPAVRPRQWEALQKLLGAAIAVDGSDGDVRCQDDGQQAQHDTPESVLFGPCNTSDQVQVLIGLRSGGLMRALAQVSHGPAQQDFAEKDGRCDGDDISSLDSMLNEPRVALRQVGHVQRLGSLPISLVQLSSPANDSSTAEQLPDSAMVSRPVAVALGERPWLLQSRVGMPVGTGGSQDAASWPHVTPLSERRIHRTISLRLPDTDDGAAFRSLVLCATDEGRLRLLNVAALTQVRHIRMTQPLQAQQQPPHAMHENASWHSSAVAGHSTSSVSNESNQPRHQPAKQRQLAARHLALHAPSGLLIAVLEAPRVEPCDESTDATSNISHEAPQVAAINPATGVVVASHMLTEDVRVTALAVWPTVTPASPANTGADKGVRGSCDEADAMDVDSTAQAQAPQPSASGQAAGPPVGRFMQLMRRGSQRLHSILDGSSQHAQHAQHTQQQQLPGRGHGGEQQVCMEGVHQLQHQQARAHTSQDKGPGHGPSTPDEAAEQRSGSGSDARQSDESDNLRREQEEHFVVVAVGSSLPVPPPEGPASSTLAQGRSALRLLRLQWRQQTPTSSSTAADAASTGWHFVVEGSVHTREAAHVIAPSHVPGILLASCGNTLAAFRLQGHSATQSVVQDTQGSHPGVPEVAAATTDWSFGARRQQVRGKPGGTGSFDGVPLPSRQPSLSQSLPVLGSDQGIPITWTLVRLARLHHPGPIAKSGLHADPETGAIAVCDSRHSMRMVALDTNTTAERPLQVVRACAWTLPAVCCLALPPGGHARGPEWPPCYPCSMAARHPGEARGAVGDLAGVLSVVVPNQAPECSLVTAATFCVGAPLTTLTQGGLRFDSQQSSGNDGSSLQGTRTAAGTAPSPSHHPPTLPQQLKLQRPFSTLSGPTTLPSQFAADMPDPAMSIVAADASGALIAARQITAPTHALLLAMESALCQDRATIPLSGRWHEAFRNRSIMSAHIRQTAGYQVARMADGDLLTAFLDLSFDQQQACVQRAVSNLAAQWRMLNEAANIVPPALGVCQLAALTVAVAARLEAVLGDLD